MPLFLLLLLAPYFGVQGIDDPCNSYTNLTDYRRSVGYKIAPHQPGICDSRLSRAWYRFTSDAGGMMPETCPDRYQCGTVIPVWLKGSHPTVGEGRVTRRACANHHGTDPFTYCCESHHNIQVLNCGTYFVYHLPPTDSCTMAYCAGDKAPCPPGQGSVTGFSPCQDVYPDMSDEPTLNPPEVIGNTFQFTCDVNYNGQEPPDLAFEVEWTFDSQPDPAVPNQELDRSHRQATLPGTALKGHMGQDVGCRARAWYQNRTVEQKGPWKESNTYWAGIKIEPGRLQVSERGGNSTVTLTSTIPVTCDYGGTRACCLYLPLDTHGRRNNMVLPNSCVRQICRQDWDPNTHTASTEVTVTAVRDQVKDGDHDMTLAFQKLQPGGSGPYLDVFTGYRPHPAQVSVTDEPTRMCYWTGDPHFRTFDGNIFDLFSVGVFTAYESDDGQFEIQIRTMPCNRRVSCQCGLVVREHDDVVRLDNCRHPGVAPHLETLKQPLNDGTNIHRSRSGKNLMMYFPSGREVRVDVGRFYHNVYLTVPASDLDKGKGLCGTFDNNRHNDYTHRNGFNDRSPCTHRQYHHLHCRPYDFSQSWSVDPQQSMFHKEPASLTRAPPDVHYCHCDSGLASSSRINCSPGADVINKAQRCGARPCNDVTNKLPSFLQGPNSGWTRRAVVYADLDVPDPEVTFPQTSPQQWDLAWPTPSGITETVARAHCHSAITQSQLFAHCNDTTDILDANVDNCVTDILYGDGYDMTDSAVEAFTSGCQFHLMQDVTNYVTDSQGNSAVKPHIVEVCTVTCLRHGRCLAGRCVCDSNYTGDDCQLEKGRPPTLGSLRGPADCDLNVRPCKLAYFDADHFEATDHFNCRVTATDQSGQGVARSPFTQQAHFLRGDRLACPLPDTKGQSLTRMEVSVTTDGHSYSNAISITVYDSNCWTCSSGHCTRTNHTCVIEGECYQEGDHKDGDVTKVCNTSASDSQWTSVAPGHYPQFDPPVLTSPDPSSHQLTCTVSPSSPSANSRFRVSWFTDNASLVSQETLTPGQTQSHIDILDLPLSADVIYCQVVSFFDGQTDYSPEVQSQSIHLMTINK